LRRITLVMLFICAAMSLSTAQTPPSTRDAESRPRKIDRLSRDVQRGNLSSIPALVDEVVAFDPLLTEFVPASGNLREQLIQAEINFHIGKHKGVSEANVAEVVNRLADVVGAPAYAHTTPAEVRLLRVQTLYMHPAFADVHRVGSRSRRPEKTLSKALTPLQAVHLVALMISQKIDNPEFQVTFEERKNRRAAAARSGIYTPNFVPNARTREMRALAATLGSRVSVRDLMTVVQQSSSLLGVEGGKQ